MAHQGCAPSPLLRHAIIVDSVSPHSSAVKSDDLVEGTRNAPLSPTLSSTEDVGSVSLGAWCASLQSSTSGSADWEHHAEADFRHHHAVFDPLSPNLSPCDKAHLINPGQLESVYVRSLSRSGVFGGLGGVGLVFKTRNAHHVVCGIIPGGNCAHAECEARALVT
jgi:hypothetical protein